MTLITNQALAISPRAAIEREGFLNKIIEEITGSRLSYLAKKIPHEINFDGEIEDNFHVFAAELGERRGYHFIAADWSHDWEELNKKVLSGGVFIIYKRLDQGSYNPLTDIVNVIRGSKIYYSYTEEHHFYMNHIGELVAVAFVKSNRLAMIPYFENDEQALKFGYDYRGDKVVIQFLRLHAEKFREIARNSIRSNDWAGVFYPASQARFFNVALAEALKGSRLASIPEFESLADGTGFIRRNFKNGKIMEALGEKADSNYLKMQGSFRKRLILETWGNFKDWFLYREVYKEGLRLRRRENLPTIRRFSDGRKAFLPAFLALGLTIPACTVGAEYAPARTLVQKDANGEYDSVVIWKIEGKEYLWFPRSDDLYILPPEGGRKIATIQERDFFNLHRKKSKDPSFGGARLAVQKRVLDVVDVGTQTGEFMPLLKHYLESRGFFEINIVGVDSGDWINDEPAVPGVRADQAQKKELVEVSNAVLQQKSGTDYQIIYSDIFNKIKDSMQGAFDIAFINAAPLDMTTSFMEASTKFLKPDGIIVLRFQEGKEIQNNVAVLMDFAKLNGWSVRIVQSDLPQGSLALGSTVYVLKYTGNYSWEKRATSVTWLLERDFKLENQGGRFA